MTAIFSGGAIFAFSRNLRAFHKFMGFTVLFEGLLMLISGAMETEAHHFLIYLLRMAMLLSTPAFYFMAVQYLLSESPSRRKDGSMFVVLATFVTVCIFLYAGGVTGRDGAAVRMVTLAGYAIFCAEQIFIQIFCFTRLPHYRSRLEGIYSNLNGKSFNLIVAILSLVALRLAAFAFESFLPGIPGSGIAIRINSAAATLFYIAICLWVCRVRHTGEELDDMQQQQEARSQVPAANDVIEARLKKLVDDKFFLEPDVNLIEVSSRVQVNSKYISDYLKFHYGETFLVYVNRLRVEYAASLLASGTLTMEDIAEKSGFTNASTFYRNFARVKGISPAQYRKSS